MPVAPPAPDIMVYACGDMVCLTVEDTVALADYIRQREDIEEALAGCNLVQRVTP